MSEQNYRRALGTVVAICILLAVALGYVLFRDHRTATTDENDPIIAKGPDATAQPLRAKDRAGEDSAPNLTPVQLSPQRLQAIGVKTAVVEMQVLNDELRVPGNVDVNERQLSYVQTRFPGWIQKVFANATYQYVRKGQALFTIYSPDLVSTEQEYLLAKQNQNAFAHDMHGAVSKEGDWLLQAAADRLRQFDIPQREIANLEQAGQVQHDIEIDSPVSGYITERNALPNQYVQADSKLYSIAVRSTAWVSETVTQTDV